MTQGVQSLEGAFNEQRQRLVRMLARLVGCRETAEDLAQEAYLKAAAAERQQRIEAPHAFLLRTARNLALDHLRRGGIQRRIFAETASLEAVDSVAAPLPSPEAGARDREQVAILDRALASVPARARQVLILHKLQGWTYPEIAAHLGISSTTVQKDLRLAMAHCLAASLDRNPD